MSSRGLATIEVSAGLVEVLGCPWVADHAAEVDPGQGPTREFGGADTVEAFILTCGDKGYDSGVIALAEVTWCDDAALLAAAPGASWQAFLGADTEQPGLWLAYTPGTGLVEASHVDHDVMIPVSWADPATRTGPEERQLARITAVRAALVDTTVTAEQVTTTGTPDAAQAPWTGSALDAVRATLDQMTRDGVLGPPPGPPRLRLATPPGSPAAQPDTPPHTPGKGTSR